MKYRVLGNTGVNVSELCLGTMTFGRESDRATSEAVFNRCREAGINFFDCANVYAEGESERILGELIADCRDEIVLVSKVYFAGRSQQINARGTSRRNIMREVEASLKRLNTDYIDLYFLHHFDQNTPLEDSLRALDDLVSQGKVVYTGVSNFAAWQVMKTQGICAKEGWAPIKCIQPMYNLIKRQAEVELFPMAFSEKIGVMTYSPLGGGLLTGKYHQGERSGPARFDSSQMYQSRYGEQWMQDSAAKFVEFARAQGYHPASLAVAWVNHHPAVTAPIIGARNVEQLEITLNAAEIDMTPDLYAEISQLSPTPPPAHDRTDEVQASK
ncbi:aldo/keto reductase [candidate division KSB3 bacterium]|uniref:Aldo/keto reductase n=1 Tax=candidate division KSB3 bacterium TaxID=2044937 RepID=A0A9D5Q4B0_9BACT|nr:aldo/keto reductase [candidate division KSB3 bacterium]MBD3323370.1 aldo/keto reductase [candidate division KSB3 bacterium]